MEDLSIGQRMQGVQLVRVIWAPEAPPAIVWELVDTLLPFLLLIPMRTSSLHSSDQLVRQET